MEAGVHVLHCWKPFHAIKKQPQTSSPGADQWCGVDVSVLEFHLQQLGSWHFYRAFLNSLCLLHNIPEDFFSVCFSPTSPSLHRCPLSTVSCCSLWSPLFHLSSLLWFPPFHFSPFLFRLAQPILPKGKRICFIPLSPFPSQPHSCSFSFPFLQAPLLLTAPCTAFSFSSPHPAPFLHHWRSTTEKTENEPGGGCYSQEWLCLWDAKYCLTSISLDCFHLAGWIAPTSSSTDIQFSMFHATQSVITPEKF